MTYEFFLRAFAGIGGLLLATLLIYDIVANSISSNNLRVLETAGEFGDKSYWGPRRIAKRLRKLLRTLAETKPGSDVPVSTPITGPSSGDLHAQAEKLLVSVKEPNKRLSSIDAEEYIRVLQLLRDTYAPAGKIDQRKFPLRSYVRASIATRVSVLQLMVVLRALREADHSGVLLDQGAEPGIQESQQ